MLTKKTLLALVALLALAGVNSADDACKNETEIIRVDPTFDAARVALVEGTQTKIIENCPLPNATGEVVNDCTVSLTDDPLATDYKDACNATGGQLASVTAELSCERLGTLFTVRVIDVPLCGGQSCDIDDAEDYVEDQLDDFIDDLEDMEENDGLQCDAAEDVDPGDGGGDPAPTARASLMVLALGASLVVSILV